MNLFEFIDLQDEAVLLTEPKKKKPRTTKKSSQSYQQTTTFTELQTSSPGYAYTCSPNNNQIQNYGFDTAASFFYTPNSNQQVTSTDIRPCYNSNTAAAIEKNRMMSINKAFEIIRLNIPTFPYERRLSKIDTLHLAISYISLLQAVLDSNMNLYDYLKTVLGSSFDLQMNSGCARPRWASSDLIVRLNWLNWSAVGVNESESRKFLQLLQTFGEMTRDRNC